MTSIANWGTKVWWLLLAPYAGAALFVVLVCAVRTFDNPDVAVRFLESRGYALVFPIVVATLIVLSAWPMTPVSLLMAAFRKFRVANVVHLAGLLGALPILILRDMELYRRKARCLGGLGGGSCSDDDWAMLQLPIWDTAFDQPDVVACAFVAAAIVAIPTILSLARMVTSQSANSEQPVSQ